MDPIEQRKQRWRDLYDRPGPPGRLFLIRCPWDEPPARTKFRPDTVAARLDEVIAAYERQAARAAWLDDDAIPHVSMLTGTEIFAEAFGCRVHLPGDNMPFALPFVESAAQADALQTPDMMSRLGWLFEAADTAKARCGREVDLRLVDLQSPMDVVALIWDKASLFVAMLEAPDAVKRLAAKVLQLQTAFLDAWFARYGRSFVAHYPDYYMPFGVSLSVDEVGAVSGEMFNAFFLPELQAMSRRYGRVGVHCCADSRHQWANFLRVENLCMLNLVRPDDQLAEARTFFADHVAMMPNWRGEGEPWTWPAAYPPRSRVVFECEAASRDEAMRISERMRDTCSPRPQAPRL